MPLLANINVGSAPNDGTGDSIRDSFIIVNENFQFVEAFFPNTSVLNINANITSTGNSAFNNITITGTTTSAGNISANYLFGNGSQLSGLSAAAANTAIYVTGNAQANITSVGTLTSLNLSGNLTGSNVSAGIIGNTGSSLVGTLATPAQTNITSVGTLSSLTVSGNVNFDNLTGSSVSSSVLSNVLVIAQGVSNEFTINIGATSNVRFTTNRSNFNAFNVNANVTFLYPAPITSGIVKTVHVKNTSGATRYIILPNTNNNRGANTIPVSNGTVATFTFVPYDTTAANVAAVISDNPIISTSPVVSLGSVSGTVTIDTSASNYQTLTTNGNISLAFSNWPSIGISENVTVKIIVSSTSHVITAPAAVSLGGFGIIGVDASTNKIYFAATGTYIFQFSSEDGGSTIIMSENNALLRPYNSSSEAITSTANASIGLGYTYSVYYPTPTSSAGTAFLANGVPGQTKVIGSLGTNTWTVTVPGSSWTGTSINFNAAGQNITLVWSQPLRVWLPLNSFGNVTLS